MRKKTAVILFNLGGPDAQESVQPFLFNLFHDKAIIGLPQPLRFGVAKLISTRRAPIAREIYAHMGGGSPIVKNTEDQAASLEGVLNAQNSASPEAGNEYKCFIAMRYWHPFADAAAKQVKDYAPDEIILMPLYPQFSTTTTESSFKDWYKVAKVYGITQPTKEICCYPQQSGFVKAVAAAARAAYDLAKAHGTPRVLFSAHGLPEKIIKAGDPYAAQCAMTVEAIRSEINMPGLDSLLCFQSRVGPLKWIEPSTEAEVRRAGQDKVPLVVVPIAFVSDHSETLVEIDIEYRHLAKECGVTHFEFVPAVGANKDFIKGLASVISQRQSRGNETMPDTGKRLCPDSFSNCPCRRR